MKIVTLYRDDCNESPMDWDGQWALYSFSNRHTNFKHPDHFLPDGKPSIGLRRKLECGTAFLLSYIEHGNCAWRIQDQGYLPAFDSVRCAGILIWEHPVREMGAKTRETRMKDAQLFLDTYNAWVNGEIYGYSVEERKTLPCGHTELELLDSCGGYYDNDLDYLGSQIKEALRGDTEIEFKGDARDLADHLKLS